MRLTILGVILTITSLALAASHALHQSTDPLADASAGENSRGGGKPKEQTIPPFEWSPPIQTIADGSNRFAIELHRKLAAGADNLVFSPFSMHAALAMTATGAKGRTLEQMEKVSELSGLLSFQNSSAPVPEIDPTSFGSALTLLIGSLGPLERRARRRTRS